MQEDILRYKVEIFLRERNLLEHAYEFEKFIHSIEHQISEEYSNESYQDGYNEGYDQGEKDTRYDYEQSGDYITYEYPIDEDDVNDMKRRIEDYTIEQQQQ